MHDLLGLQIKYLTSLYYSIGLHSNYPPATSLNPPLHSPLPVDPPPPTSLWLPYSLNFLSDLISSIFFSL